MKIIHIKNVQFFHYIHMNGIHSLINDYRVKQVVKIVHIKNNCIVVSETTSIYVTVQSDVTIFSRRKGVCFSICMCYQK